MSGARVGCFLVTGSFCLIAATIALIAVGLGLAGIGATSIAWQPGVVLPLGIGCGLVDLVPLWPGSGSAIRPVGCVAARTPNRRVLL